MNKIRLPIMIVLISLLAVTVIAFWTYQRSAGSPGASRSNVSGLGELRRLDAQQLIPDTGASGGQDRSSTQASGFGDLRRFEAQQAMLEKEAQDSGKSKFCLNASTTWGEHDAGASAPAGVLQAIGCPVP